MNIGDIKNALQSIIDDFSRDEFIYDLLLAYGISKTSITRLKKGDFNLSKVEGEVLYKGKVFFKQAKTPELLTTIEHASKDTGILKHKPRFLIVTDFTTVVAKDTKTRLNVEFPIAELPAQAAFFGPLGGAEAYKISNDNKADRDAAYQLGRLYDLLVTDNPGFNNESHGLNLFLSRLLFCFFAEDTGIFSQNGIFTKTLVQYTESDGRDIHSFLNELFRRLNTEQGDFPEHLAAFPYVNGGLFRDAIECPKFSVKSRNILIECGELDWSEINPDIFGSMIQAVADPEERSNLGMHYTSVPNILKLIRPLFLDELEAEAEKQWDNAAGLHRLLARLGRIKFFDPACGSGNFLIITYKELRLLEIKMIQRLVELETQSRLYFTAISLGQFYGIEIKDFAHEMALLGLWLAEHQMNKVFDDRLEGYGQTKPILPLKEAGHITLGNAARIDWKDACPWGKDDELYVLGNPPYLGARMQDGQQKADMDFVFKSFGKYRDLDYIAIWFYKAAKFISGINAQAAFVSTNSVCQGQQVALLWPSLLTKNLEIAFAHRSFKWSNNAKGSAGVSVIILGLRNISGTPKFIFDDGVIQQAKNINAYLLDGPNVFVGERLQSISGFPRMNFGNMPNDGGGLILTEAEVKKNVNTDSRFLRKLIGSSEFIDSAHRYCLWIEDKELSTAEQNTFIAQRIEMSREHRRKSKDAGTNKLAARAHQFRDRNTATDSQILVPRVSSERREYIPLGILTPDAIILDSAMAIYDAQPWLFGVLHSKMHMVWVDAVGGKLKTDYRYSAKLVYNTFPFPDITLAQKERVRLYVLSVLDERAKWAEKTMAWLYNPETMPASLRQAHKDLDLAIEQIYRPGNPFSSDAERLEHLFKRYEEMVAAETLFAKGKKGRGKKGCK
ncbi:MAG: class I SAM-dependent DNA methyltransferase [Bacteroidetes bacterium]|nr:class I SAM-dependent DNA methyltransferase [Bacteroidota bacterium]MBS1629670.1 class I SAM-dependent DNA methyltransferase [Bacteroidota bacterium]